MSSVHNPLAVLANDKPVFYCLSEIHFKEIKDALDRLEDFDLGSITDSRVNEPRLSVDIDDL